ncbi:uncharacterized protein LOC143303912 [Bombus vancouverensis nearcticus]|uniref:uncharacterized protein LOC143303912 n=1 Tax=Bombus vancouverensis nearcticus TaxID=2705178 RepID=UPI00402B24DF
MAFALDKFRREMRRFVAFPANERSCVTRPTTLLCEPVIRLEYQCAHRVTRNGRSRVRYYIRHTRIQPSATKSERHRGRYVIRKEDSPGTDVNKKAANYASLIIGSGILAAAST